MENFEVINPTRILFGKNQLFRLPELLRSFEVQKIMIVYGGGSVKQLGLLDKLLNELKGFDVFEFGGVEANPEYATLMDGVALAQKHEIDFFLAVGGGSVIDGVKFMSGALFYEGEPWDVLDKKEGCMFEKALPFGTVLTLPATGSEANSGAVISRRDLKQKLGMGGPLFFPKFSFCNPELVATLPKRQIANGIIDAYTHTLEQYLTFPSDNVLQERQAESILKTLIDIRGVIENPSDYKLASNLMWCATQALNGNLRCGVISDWATHMIGHELTAMYGIDHAQSLAIIAPRLYEHQFENKQEKLIQYGKRVWNLHGTDQTIAKLAIEKTEEFFQSLGVKTRISEYTSDYEGTDSAIMNVFLERGWVAIGERQAIRPEDVKSIVKSAY